MNRRIFLGIGLILTALLVLLAGFSLRFGKLRRLNVLLVTLDTTRADRIGCYGYRRAATAALDRLAARGLLFENAFANVPLTLPSHATILTGLHPPEHGIRVNGRHRLSAAIPTLAEILRNRGYRTAAFIASAVLDRRFGLDRGFDLYDDKVQPPRQGARAADAENPADVIAERVIAWLDRQDDKAPFFAWVHFFDPHSPYEPPTPYRTGATDPYDGEIAFMDAQFGRVLEFLNGRPTLAANTLVVVCGDHGEAFGEHEEYGHGMLLYEPTMRVPFLIVPPDGVSSTMRIAEAVALVDVAPTILATLEVKPPRPMSGRALVRWHRGKIRYHPRPSRGSDSFSGCYGETHYPMYAYGWAFLESLTTERWRYIRGPDPELYDRQHDPAELRNVVTETPGVTSQLRAQLETFLKQMRPVEAEPARMDASLLAKLRSLGYLAGRGTTPTPRQHLDKDPKKMMRILNFSLAVEQNASRLLVMGQPDQAVALLAPLIAEYGDLPAPRKLMVEALEAMGKLAEAREHIEAYLAHDPGDRLMLGRLAKLELQQGRTEKAEALLRDALALPVSVIEPVESNGVSEVETTLRLDLGLALVRLGRKDEAIMQFKQILSADPNNFQAHNNLGAIYTERGDYEPALEHLRKAVALAPDRPAQLANLATALLLARKSNDALAAAQSLLTFDPTNATARAIIEELSGKTK
ncbi:MAG: sulfatase-like hydrolase/transferase [Kiritimatiellia bacterium]